MMVQRIGGSARAATLFVTIAIATAALSSCVSAPRFDDAEIASAVLVEERNRHLFLTTPTQERATGLIFYPGGLVAPGAYVPLLDDVAAAGYPVVIPRMPFGLAVFAPLRGVELQSEYPGVARWVIAGHSLGGAMAARAVFREPEPFDGLILVAAYPANSDDLSDRDLSVVSIYADRDGLALPEEIEASEALLPADTVFVEISGGNHAQFGSYGPQDGDTDATIPRDTQQRLTVRAILELLSSFSPTP